MGEEEGLQQELQLQVGLLVPLGKNGEESPTDCSIPIFQGSNTVGRSSLKTADMQISRNHLLVHVSSSAAEISVTGTNPVILKSGLGIKTLAPRTKSCLAVGDIVELLPGRFPFKYMSCRSLKGKAAAGADANVEVAASNKRKRQIEEDEAFARALQEMENQNPTKTPRTPAQHSHSESILRQAAKLPYGFQLMRVQGLPEWANAGCVKISDVIKGEILVAILSNYMVDVEWLLSACPHLNNVPQVVMIHGESDVAGLERSKPGNWLLYKPPLRISFGTHHSKAMFLVYPTGVRVIIHTANLISVDWNYKSQGLWMQDFPFKSMTGKTGSSHFEDDLVDYLTALEWSGCTVDIKQHGQMRVNAAYFRNFDYSNAAVRLVASVPGYHHGRHLTKWGHMKFASILREQIFQQKFRGSPLVYQFSSLGSIDEKWMEELVSSLCGGSTPDRQPLGSGQVQIVFPTVEDVRLSLEGYSAGGCIPSPLKNVEKAFLKKYWSRWEAEHTGRSRAMPHIKTYVRYHQDNSLAWLCLTSANLSKAAWGALQKNKTQLMIRSYELGVVFLPSLLGKFKAGFSCTDDAPSIPAQVSDEQQDVELCTIAANTTSEKNTIKLALPYALPPSRYSSQDEPWCWDKRYIQPDVHGKRWPRA